MKNRNATPDLNANEIKVLDALVIASDFQGHDFGFTEDAWRREYYPQLLDPNEISKSQFSGYVSQLSQKGYIKNLAENDKSWAGGFQLTLKGAAYAGVVLNYETN